MAYSNLVVNVDSRNITQKEGKMIAYIDPTIGTMALQVIISAIVGSVIFFRAYIYKIVKWICRVFRK